MNNFRLTQLNELEAEAIFVIREVAAQFENPALLFSSGKDSIVCFHLARKAFRPGRIPFPLVHIDTGHNFQETINFRDNLIKQYDVRLIVGSVQQSIDLGRVVEEKGFEASRNRLQTTTLLDTIEDNKFDCCIGGARRDEEKARAKERFFSHRDEFGQWDPKNQRPELWNIFNGRKNPGEHFRVFPISNWTELIYGHSELTRLKETETVESRTVRFRTIGDMTCTGAVESSATTVQEIIDELAVTRVTERGSRIDDKRSDAAMEDRKKEGYF
jgi:sulfate adenylyltransferase subunit 2